ncbi:hypothetical protein JD276_04770 [Leucobacter sp. CSA1]|uniref:Uncharacterized protein n=1 Tax=Leucobacter chromiisoli TaxID=2796471 RepID=A0A934Q7Z8_9MICO|nr:hypothetical protein [Leucobacter chromiisoli]MBK0418344.1 hypothetical protein [Leucobacter chromiisoli]
MTHTINASATARPARPLHTPYHALGGERGVHVPSWVGHRSVYRSAGRTLYLVETDRLEAARGDLDRLASQGWDVQVERARAGSAARIALTQQDLAVAA